MGRQVKVTAGILNIRIHPHPEGIYEEFIEALYALKRIVQLRGDRYGIISSIDRSERDEGLISGTVSTFLKIDTDGAWFDVDTLQEAATNLVSSVVIPTNLRPNTQTYDFIFDLKKHKLYFEHYQGGKYLTPNMAYRLFQALASDLAITSRFRKANITIVQDKSTLNRLLKLPVIKRVTVDILRPNPDFLSPDFLRNIEQSMSAAHAQKLSITFEAGAGDSLVITDGLKDAAEAGVENGNVNVVGRDVEQGNVNRNTSGSPKLPSMLYDSELSTETQAFRALVARERGEG